MSHWRIHFSLMHLMLAISFVALGIAMVQAWPTSGAFIGPAVIMIASAAIPCLALFRRNRTAKTFLKATCGLFAFTIALYLSIGPACWAMASYNTPDTKYPLACQCFSYVYRPIATNALFSPEPIRSASMVYFNWWMPKTATFHDWGKGIGWSVPGWTFTVIHY